MKRYFLSLALCSMTAGLGSAANLFSGVDVGNATAVGVNTNAALNSFLTALIGSGTDDLESIALNTTSAIGSANGVAITASCTNCDATRDGVTNDTTNPTQSGYATSGTHFFWVGGAETGVPLTSQNSVLTLTFGAGVHAFGLFLTDIQNTLGLTTVSFNDGLTTTNFQLPDSGTATGCPAACAAAGSQFFGFTTTGLVTTITFTTVQQHPSGQSSARDIFGIDDLIIGDISAVPEPATLGLIGIALAGLGALKFRRRR